MKRHILRGSAGVVALVALVALAFVSCEQRKAPAPAPVTDQPSTSELSPPTLEHVTLTSGEPSTATKAVIERGKYLVTVGGCNDCHTTKKMGANGPEPDVSRLLAGHPADMKLPAAPKLPANAGPWAIITTGSLTAWSGPWGITYAANLTPDRETGIGNWSEEQFVNALRTGKHLGAPAGREILPPMPWFNYAGMTDADFKAVFAYLKSIPEIKNPVPAPIPSAPPPPPPRK